MAAATKKLSVTVPVITHNAMRDVGIVSSSATRRRLLTTRNRGGSILAVLMYDSHLLKRKALMINLVGSLRQKREP